MTNGRPPESLPSGWKLVRVRDVGEVRLGRQRSPKNHNGPNMRPYLRVANVYEDRIDTSDVLWMNFSPQEYETYKLQVGDILLNEGQSRELVGRPAIYRGEVPDACFQNTLVRFRVYEGLLPEYALIIFRHYLHSGRFQEIATSTTNIAHLGAERFAELEFPLPPLVEQRRIVERVEALLAQARTAREALAPLPAQARTAREALAPLPALVRQLRQSVLAAAFSGRLSEREPGDEPAGELLERIRAERALLGGRRGREEARALPEGLPELPEGWAWAQFGDLLVELKNGFFAGTPANERPGVPILRISAVRPLDVNFSAPRFIRKDAASLSDYYLQVDDLLFTRYNGSLDLVGVCGRVRQVAEPTIYPDKLIRARVVEGVLPAYVEFFFASGLARRAVESRAKSSAGQHGISGKDLKDVPVPLAPLAEQRRIVARVEALLAQADVIEQAVAAVSRRIADVERAVLARAFRGELVSEME